MNLELINFTYSKTGMQFKYPEILWALLLLLIPLIIHLFQLRRFKKTPFTNVKLLKKVVSESRKSSSIKKWLILFTRLGMVAGLVFAFAQPFTANDTAFQPKEFIFYLDNSFSMQATSDNGTLLQNTVQDFLKSIPQEQNFTLFTNDEVFENVEIKNIQNVLLELSASTNQLNLEEVVLRANTYFSSGQNTQKNIVIISDFQERMGSLGDLANSDTSVYFIKPAQEPLQNASIDTLYLGNMNQETIELIANISSSSNMETTPVSLYSENKLIAKTSAKFNKDNKAQVSFSIPANQSINGKLVISDSGLAYDNQFYFNIGEKDRIKLLSIGSVDNSYLSRLYSSDEFIYSNVSLNQLNYGTIESQNFIILNELETLPTALTTALNTFIEEGGSLAITPGITIDINSYNSFTSKYANTKYLEKLNQEVNISEVAFNHPIFRNVFEKNVTNFQYPKVSSYYAVNSTAPSALSLQNNAPFLFGTNSAYFFTASLTSENSTFKNSPLIVPTFYNMAVNSLKIPQLYAILGSGKDIDIPVTLSKDNTLKVSKENYEFIPEQRVLPKKVRVSFDENPKIDGIYTISSNENNLRNISFNYDRKESDLNYLDLSRMDYVATHDSVSGFFEERQKASMVNEFWKWFAILALLFVLIETLLQRFFK